ncbi:MAG TPA: SLBB domain-containing protein [Candidatus Sulfotelmatobacter sp.]|nr:SLBB domain-containing protein [Candidatus Sulfotelmatobacter sp.]
MGLLLAGCGSVKYTDPVNPKSPYTFPGQTASAPAAATPTARTAPTTAESLPKPATAPAVPVAAPAVTVEPAAISQPAAALPTMTVAPVAPAPVAMPSMATGAGKAAAAEANASLSVLRPGDSLVVSFSDLPAPGLQPVQSELGEDGKVTLHHNVSVSALGKTTRQLEQEIRQEYVPKYYKYLTVTVKTDMRFIHVSGEVKMPGQYPWRGETSVLRALGQAGWVTDWAKKSKIQLTRANGQKFVIDCEKAQTDPAKDLLVYPGDYINVPRKSVWGW